MTEEEVANKFNSRIIGMMADHEITMSEALWWDFEGVNYVEAAEVCKKGGLDLVRKQFRQYLTANGFTKTSNLDFYTDIFTGKSVDLELQELRKKDE